MSEAITPRRAETQGRLLAAAVSVFAEKGVLGAAVEEICERAGFTRGAFYSNYASKDDLVLALLNRDWADSTANVLNLTSDSLLNIFRGSLADALRAAMAHFLSAQTTGRNWILVSAEIRLYAAREPSIRQAYREFHAAHRRQTVAALEQVAAHYGAELSMPIEQAMEVLAPVYEMCMLNALLRLPADGDSDVMQLDPEDFAEVMAPLTFLLDSWVVRFQGAEAAPAAAPHA